MTMKIYKKELEDMLLEEGLVTPEQLDKCKEIQCITGKTLLNVLIENKCLCVEDLAITKNESRGIPHIRLRNYSIQQEILDEIPEAMVHKYQVLPVGNTEDCVVVAMTEPINTAAIDAISVVIKKNIEPMAALSFELDEAIARYYPCKQTRKPCDESGENEISEP